MGAPAAVAGDQITGACVGHQMIGPTGTPAPAPPMPFAAPITTGLARSVLICGKPAAMAGAGGMCTPPHVGLHASDPAMLPIAQQGSVLTGSTTVLIEGAPAATAASTVRLCFAPGSSLMATAATVLIG